MKKECLACENVAKKYWLCKPCQKNMDEVITTITNYGARTATEIKKHYTNLKRCMLNHSDELFYNGVLKLVAMAEELLDLGDDYLAERLEDDIMSFYIQDEEDTEEYEESDKDDKNDRTTFIYEDYRKKYPCDYRCSNGLYVRSRAEREIANWLFNEGIKFEYEKVIYFDNSDKQHYCDFYLPQYNLYIEFWGINYDERYLKNKAKKMALYNKLAKKGELSIASLYEKDLLDVEGTMQALLRKFKGKKKR